MMDLITVLPWEIFQPNLKFLRPSVLSDTPKNGFRKANVEGNLHRNAATMED